MIEVEVEDEAWRELARVETLVERAAEAALAGLNSPSPSRGGSGWGDVSAATAFPDRSPHPRPLPSGGRGEDIAVLLTDDDTIRDLNARFRGKNAPTNVLSFPAPETAHPHLGDIALAHGVCAAEAAAQGKTLADHLSHLVVHGVLHLLGYDHQADEPADAMEAMERDILSKLGVADPYRQDLVHAGP